MKTPKTRGGAAPYRKGAAFERETQKYLESEGYLVVRQPKSQSPFDLIAIRRNQSPEIIQCKTNGKISKKEVEKLLEVAVEFCCIPLLAYKRKYKVGPFFKDLSS